MTGSQLAQAALEMIGAWSPADGDVDADKVARALFHANLLRGLWNAHDLALHAIERQSFAWTANDASMTIGPSGADLTGTRPLEILVAKVIPAGATNEVDVDILTARRYARIANKAQTAACFSALRYEPTGRLIGTITVWPVPTGAPTLLLHNKVLLTEFTADTDIVVPEAAYEAALVSSLAKRLSVIFGKPWTTAHEEIRVKDWATLQDANIEVPDEVCMPAGFPGSRGGGVSDSEYDSGDF